MNITELEAMVLAQGRSIKALEVQLGALKANAGAPPKIAAHALSARTEPQGVRILYPVEKAKIALPNEAEMKLLPDAVFAKYPRLRPYTLTDRYSYQDQADFFKGFCEAFAFVAVRGRTDEVDTKRSLGWWSGEASDWLKTQGYTATISSSHLLVAAIAAGDVGFTQSDELGNQWAFALATHGGRPATDAWRNVLRGQLRPPLPGAYKTPAVGPTVRFEGSAR